MSKGNHETKTLFLKILTKLIKTLARLIKIKIENTQIINSKNKQSIDIKRKFMKNFI